MIPIDAVEVAARAARELEQHNSPWGDLTEPQKDNYRDEARTVLMSVHSDWRPHNGAAK